MRFPKAPLKLILPMVAILITALVAGLLIATKPKPKTQTTEEKTWQVHAITAELGMHAPLQPLLGTVISPSQVTLAAAIEADVLRVHVLDGQSVKKGDELIVLDDREASRRLLQRQGELDEIEALLIAERTRHETDKASLKNEEMLLALSDKSVERLRQLAQKDLGAQSQLDDAIQAQARQQLALLNRRYLVDDHASRLDQLKAKQKQAKARVDLAQLEQERTRIVAPFDARVVSRKVSPGQRVKNNEPLVTIYDMRQLEVIAQLPWSRYEQLSQAISTGTMLEAQASIADHMLTLTLSRLAAQADAAKGGLDAFFVVNEGQAFLQTGRVLNIDLRLPAVADSVVAPYEALYGLDKVYRIVDGRLQAVVVQVQGEAKVATGGRHVVIRGANLKQGDLILTTKFANAMEGLRVQVVQ